MANPTATYQAFAAAFYNLPIEIYQYLVNTIQYQAYQGAMKGPLAVLETKAGNDWDTDSLLAALLQPTGIQTQYAWGEVVVDTATVENWLGVQTKAAAYDALKLAGLNPYFGSFDANNNFQHVTTNSGDTPNSPYLMFDHAWLEAAVTPPGASGTGIANLDPTWKFREFQPGVANMLSDVQFVTADTAGSYLNSGVDETAADFYEAQVRTYLAGHDPSQTIADVPYTGPIHPQSISALPMRSPFSLLQLPVRPPRPWAVQSFGRALRFQAT